MIERSLGAEQQLLENRLGFSADAALERLEQQLDAAQKPLETFPQSVRTHLVLHRPGVRSLNGWGLPLDCVALTVLL
jgi:hypothetical protein